MRFHITGFWMSATALLYLAGASPLHAQGVVRTRWDAQVKQGFELAPEQSSTVPWPLRFRTADYPVERMRQGYSGEASVECIVLPDGSVTGAKVIKATHEEFGEAALAAVAEWSFRPWRASSGKAESGVRIVCRFVFDLPDE